MDKLENALKTAADLAWGWPLIILLIGGGAYLMVLSRFIPLLGLRRAWVAVRRPEDSADPDDGGAGEIHPLRALAASLSSVVGLGNIAGVAVAITQGGPGAVFWMWLAALVGMATKFFTASLSVMYRKQGEDGVPRGGPMYYIEVGLGRRFRFLAVLFSACGLIGCLALFQANQLSEILDDSYRVSPWVTGVVCAALVAVVVLGGIKRIGAVASRLVPAMCLLYVAIAVIVLASNWDAIPGIFAQIFHDAFHGSAMVGGAAGVTVSQVITIGIRRGAFSNEAGIGTSPLAYGAAQTRQPVRQGLIAMIDPFIDTIVVCTLTALVILCTDAWRGDEIRGIALTSHAFESALGEAGRLLVTLAAILFAVSTMLGYSYYGRKCFAYLAGDQRGNYYDYFYIVMIVVGAVWSVGAVIHVIDTAFALMALPNMIATLILAPRVMRAARRYFAGSTASSTGPSAEKPADSAPSRGDHGD